MVGFLPFAAGGFLGFDLFGIFISPVVEDFTIITND
jgi:hypothetical protein